MLIAPVVALNAKTRLRVITVELVAVRTCVNVPPTTIWSPTWTIE